MTRNQALLSVFAMFEGENSHTEEIQRLKEIARGMPFTEWDDATVKDAVANFMAEHGRVPTVTDFKKENGLPSNPVIRQRYQMNLRAWLNENFPTYYKPQVTRKQALEFAYGAAEGGAREKIGEILAEYPVCRWTLENIKDGVQEFYRNHGRLPYEREFGKRNRLPEYGHLLYQYKCGLREWYETYCKELFEICERRVRPVRDYLKEFEEEYRRIKPCSKEEFNRRRNAKNCCLAEVVMRNSRISSWSELLRKCNLQPYQKQSPKLITEVEVIVLNEKSEETYRYLI